MAATLTIVNQHGQTLATHRLGNTPLTLHAQDQVQYRLAGEGGLAPANVEAARAGNDLLVRIDGEAAFTIEDYFLHDESGLKNPLLGMNQSGQYVAYGIVEAPSVLPVEHVLAEEVALASTNNGSGISPLAALATIGGVALTGAVIAGSRKDNDKTDNGTPRQPQTPFDPNQPAPPPVDNGNATPPPSGGDNINPPPSGGNTTPPPSGGGNTTPPPSGGGNTNPPPQQPMPNGSITIEGEAKVGQTLIAKISDADGISGNPQYQWLADGQPIANATQSTYTLTVADKGKAISVQAIYTDAKNTAESPTSAATAPVIEDAPAPQPHTPNGSVTIEGEAKVGQTLIAKISDAEGISGSPQYQWLADGQPIQGATQSTYTLTAAEKGKAISVQASYTDAKNTAESPTSTASVQVIEDTPAPNHPPSGGVAIHGVAQVGKTLSASHSLEDSDGLGQITYKWFANGAEVGQGDRYTVRSQDQGKTITVKAEYTDGKGTPESVASAATAPVQGDSAHVFANIAELMAAPLNAGERAMITDFNHINDNIGIRYTVHDTLSDTAAGIPNRIAVPLANGKYALPQLDDHTLPVANSAANVEAMLQVAKTYLDAGDKLVWDGKGQTPLYVSGTPEPVKTPDGKDAFAITCSAFINMVMAGWKFEDTTYAAAQNTSSYGWGIDFADKPQGDTGPYGANNQLKWMYWKDQVALYNGKSGGEENYRAGDILFFSKQDPEGAGTGGNFFMNVYHSAIYIGNGKVMHSAGTYHGNGVVIEDLANLKADLTWIGRPHLGNSAIAIEGKAETGQTLTAQVTDSDGLPADGIRYQWYADNRPIDGATAQTYTLTDADQGKAVTVRAQFSDATHYAEAPTSAAVTPVAPQAPAASALEVANAQNVTEGQALEYAVTLNAPSRAGQVLKLETLFHNSSVPHDQLSKTADPFAPGEYLANGTVFTRDVKNIAVTPLGNSAAISKHLLRLAQYGPKYYEDAELMKKLEALDRGENVDIPGTGNGAHPAALTALNTEAYNIPVYIVDSTDPKQTYATFSSDDPRVLASDDIMRHTMGRIPFPTHATPAGGGDKSFAVYDKGTGMMREYFYAEADNGGWKVSAAGYHQTPAGLDELGAQNYWMQLDHGGSSVVMMLNPLSQIGISELMAGKINHAVSVTLPDAMIGRPSFPAKLSDGSDTFRHAAAEGQWFRIKPGVDLDTYLRPDASGNSKALNPLTLMIAKAAQQYGGYGADRNLHNIAFNAEPAHNYLAQGKENPWRKGGELYRKLQAPGVDDPFNINDFPWELVEWMPLDWNARGQDAGVYADDSIRVLINGIEHSYPAHGGDIVLPEGVTDIRVKVPTLTHNNFLQTERVELKAELLENGQSLSQDGGSGQVLDAPSPFADAAPDGNSGNDILVSPKLNTAGFADLKTLEGEALYRYLAEHGADILAQSQDGTASTLRGSAGNDVLIAGRGVDLLEGGPGADTFVFIMNGENSQPYHGNDRILDFNPAEDRIILTRGKDWLQTDAVEFAAAPEVQRLHFKTWLPENPPVIHLNAVEIKTHDGRLLSSAEVLETVRIHTPDNAYRHDGKMPAIHPNPPPNAELNGDTRILEGEAARYRITLDKPATQDTTFTLVLEHGTTRDADFARIEKTLVLQAGMQSLEFTVQSLDDAISENAETYTVRLADAQGANLGANASLATTIADNDHGAHNHNGSVSDSRFAGDRAAEAPYFIQALDIGKGYGGHLRGHEPGAPLAVTYRFAEEAVDHRGNPLTGFRLFSPAQQAAIREVFEHIARYVDIRFSEGHNATLNLYLDDLGKGANSTTLGEAVYGGSVHLNSAHYAADDAFRRGEPHYTFQNGKIVLYHGWSTALHEIGHSLGLRHPFENPDYNLGPAENRDTLSVMSYTAGETIARIDVPGGNGYYLDVPVPQNQLGIYDLAALHYRYGVNPAHNAGDDTYTFKPYNSKALGNNLYIADGSGQDLFDASAETLDLNIDLTPGSWIHAGEKSATLVLNADLTPTSGQMFIGYGTQIESAKGGSGNDTLKGNSADNYLFGYDGNDTINGGGGRDQIEGGRGADTLSGGDGADTFIFKSPFDGTHDTILDLDLAAGDLLQLEDDIFTALGEGRLAADQFVLGREAKDANDHILYDPASGELAYDHDGNGAGASVLIANIGAGMGLNAGHIEII